MLRGRGWEVKEGTRQGTEKVVWAVSIPTAKGHAILLWFLILNNKESFH